MLIIQGQNERKRQKGFLFLEMNNWRIHISGYGWWPEVIDTTALLRSVPASRKWLPRVSYVTDSGKGCGEKISYILSQCEQQQIFIA